jgi:hypothetical protein
MEAERRQVTVLFTDMVGLYELLGAFGGGSSFRAYEKFVEANGRSHTPGKSSEPIWPSAPVTKIPRTLPPAGFVSVNI